MLYARFSARWFVIPFIFVISSACFLHAAHTAQSPVNQSFYDLKSSLLNDSIYHTSFKGPGDLISVHFPRNAAFRTIAQNILVAPLSLHEKNALWALFLVRSMEYPHIRHREWAWKKTLRESIHTKAVYHPQEVLADFRTTSASAMQATKIAALLGAMTGLGASVGIPLWLKQPISWQWPLGSSVAGGVVGMYSFWLYQAHMLKNFESCVSTLFKTVQLYKKYLPVRLIEDVANLQKECALLNYKTLTGIDYKMLETHIEQVLIFYKDLCTQAGVAACADDKHFILLPAPGTHPENSAHFATSAGYGTTANR